jgi:phage tail sheath gpL-like
MPSTVIFINHDNHEEELETSTSNPKEYAKKLENYIKAISSGSKMAQIEQLTDDTDLARASATCTVASIQADDTVTINGVTLTGKASPSGELQFDSDGSDTVVATALVACINANSSLTGICTAANVAGVVTISAYCKGLIGNAITLASSDGSRLAVSAARLAGGTGMGEAPVTYNLGKA